MRQLVLDLPVSPRFGADDFLVSPSNESAYAVLEQWPNWPEPFVRLRGPAGSGKSHLAAIWALRAGAVTVEACAVSDPHVSQLASAPALVVENLDRGPLDESALFHLANLAREARAPVLFTSRDPIDAASIRTPDLLSRLRLAPSLEIGPPDDSLLKAVLVKLFLDRQLVVDTSVIDYVAQRIERSLARAAAIVAELDGEALSRGRRVTRPMAAALLERDTDIGADLR